MTLAWRLGLATLVLLALAVAELGLRRHLAKADASVYPELRKALAELPQELGGVVGGETAAVVWRGEDHPHAADLRQLLPYKADDLLYRVYQREPAGPAVHLYAVYSIVGDDRKHHPEICIRDVRGAEEELGARQRLSLDSSNQRTVARFRFRTAPREVTTVYYWHYSFPPLPQEGRDWLQTLHLQLRQGAPSITVQVSTTAPTTDLLQVEQTFLPALDSAFRTVHLPASALIGCDRLPIGLVRE